MDANSINCTGFNLGWIDSIVHFQWIFKNYFVILNRSWIFLVIIYHSLRRK